MGENISELKKNWNWQSGVPASEKDVDFFQCSNKLLIPEDLSNYFKVLNGSNGYDEGLFNFYSLNEFQSFDQNKSLFIFADYQFKLFSYVIKLYSYKTSNNEVYVFCGDNYKIVSKSFTEFIDLCLQESQRLFFND